VVFIPDRDLRPRLIATHIAYRIYSLLSQVYISYTFTSKKDDVQVLEKDAESETSKGQHSAQPPNYLKGTTALPTPSLCPLLRPNPSHASRRKSSVAHCSPRFPSSSRNSEVTGVALHEPWPATIEHGRQGHAPTRFVWLQTHGLRDRSLVNPLSLMWCAELGWDKVWGRRNRPAARLFRVGLGESTSLVSAGHALDWSGQDLLLLMFGRSCALLNRFCWLILFVVGFLEMPHDFTGVVVNHSLRYYYYRSISKLRCI
jgi:hypothetical protein